MRLTKPNFEAPPHRQLQKRTRGEDKTKERSLLYTGNWLRVQKWSLMTLGDRTHVVVLRGKLAKMAASRLLGGKRTGGNSGNDIQHHCSEPTMQLPFTIALSDAASLQNGTALFPDGTTRGSKALSHTIQPNSQWVASFPACEQIHTNEQQDSRCLFSVESRAARQSLCLNRVPNRTFLHTPVLYPDC